ncbi:hypothetical protein F0U61_42650 [Archangium violaceum]|uniref:DUF6119 family protein n=1 Tax=Archangium violaceum TaxID=83451 RepID=UPI002B3135EC|nr:hypothetical protein F0U61_42650 [Archangium violaceum]
MKKRTAKTAPKAKTRHLTFLLIHKELKSPEAALKEPTSLSKKPLPADYGFEGTLYTFESLPKEPRWVSFVKEGFPDGISLALVAAPAAVLFIKADSRLFALTFGQGRHLLKPDSYEVDFGLKVTLNSVDEKRLRSLDLRTFEEQTVHTRRQVSRNSSLDAFSVDVVRDLLGAVTGEPSDKSLAKRLTGRDALALTGAVAFSELADKCKALLKAYKSLQYKTTFPWVDNIRLVRDSTTLDRLNKQLLESINNRDLDKIHLAPPEVIEWDGVGFRYPGERTSGEEPHSDLDLEECLVALSRQEGVALNELKLSLDDLKRCRIRAVFEDSAFEPERWSLYSCLVAELNDKEALYVLSAGQWFKIEKTFAAQTFKETAEFVKDVTSLPTAKPNEKEDAYNKRVAQSSGGTFALLDRLLIKSRGAHTQIEACDLFSRPGQFIHVKRKVRSSALSHLFSQGTVSAETFLQDEHFRKRLKELVGLQSADIAKSLGNPTEKPEPGKHEILFAVITRSPKEKWPQALPFFSQLNFSRSARRLQMLGFKVALCRVGEEK